MTVSFRCSIAFDALLGTRSKNRRRLTDVKKVSRVDMSFLYSLIVPHAFSSCDITNSFKEIVKVKPLKILGKKMQVQDSHRYLRESQDVKEDLFLTMYCSAENIRLRRCSNCLRYEMLQSMCYGSGKSLASKINQDLSSLPSPSVLSSVLSRVWSAKLLFGKELIS